MYKQRVCLRFFHFLKSTSLAPNFASFQRTMSSSSFFSNSWIIICDFVHRCLIIASLLFFLHIRMILEKQKESFHHHLWMVEKYFRALSNFLFYDFISSQSELIGLLYVVEVRLVYGITIEMFAKRGELGFCSKQRGTSRGNS